MKTPIFHHLKIEIHDKNGNIEMIPYNDILYMIYDKPYTLLVWMEKGKTKKKLLQISLVYMEQYLPVVFFRCNPVSILNLCYLKKYDHVERQIAMEDGKIFNISKRKHRDFRVRLASLPRLSPLCTPCLTCTNACLTKDSLCATKKNAHLAHEIDRMV
ncbi:MAG: LytTR family transcriptional regulator DNA-binding domain-containing protein [Odoribacteraceae bacterium]|jgi:DNA-binding LytR/AlgR family response regulator|nr:LytTR family transcriptional regulator DNA-binding domain-containing protein [Odoribacteraceae bacterium]